MKTIFLPYSFPDAQSAEDEETYIYTHTCVSLLGHHLLVVLVLLLGSFLSIVLAVNLGLQALINEQEYRLPAPSIGLFAALCIISILAFFYAYKYYKSFPEITALAKIYIRINVLPFGTNNTIVHCAWLLSTNAQLTQIFPNLIKNSFLSLNIDISSLDNEAHFLKALDNIALTDMTKSFNLAHQLLYPTDATKKSFASILQKGTLLTNDHRTYCKYYYATITDRNEPFIIDQLVTYFETLEKNLTILRRAKEYLENQCNIAQNFLYSLQDGSSFIDSKADDILTSYQNFIQGNIAREPVVKNLMFEIRENIRKELSPSVENEETRYDVMRAEIIDRFKQHAEEIDVSFGKLASDVEEKISHHIETIKRHRRKLQSAVNKKTQRQSRINQIRTELINAHAQAKATEQAMSLNASDNHVAYKDNLRHFHSEIRSLNKLLLDDEQQVVGINDDISDLMSQISEEEEEMLEQKKQYQQLELDKKSKFKTLLNEKESNIKKLDDRLQAQLRYIKAPLLEIENIEDNLIKTWNNAIGQIRFKHSEMLAKYQRVTIQMIKYRRQAFDNISKKALRTIEFQIGQAEESKQRIVDFLWPRNFWNGFDVLYIPIWLINYKDHPDSESVICAVVDEKFLFTSTNATKKHRFQKLDLIPEITVNLQKMVIARLDFLKSYANTKSILNSTNVNNLSAQITKLQQEQKIKKINAVVAKIILKRQNLM